MANDNPICNLCGLSCLLTEYNHIYGTQYSVPSGLINITAVGGYHSTPGNGVGALDDMSAYKFSMCEFCLDWLFTQFKMPPYLYDHTVDDLGVFVPAEERVKNDEWRKDKETFFAEKKRRDEARANRGSQ